MSDINFDRDFEVLALTPAETTLKELQARFSELVSADDFQDKLRANDEQAKSIVAAYSNLQLLLKPYESLDLHQKRKLLDALNEMPDFQLKRYLGIYPHNSSQFYWDSKNYPKLRDYLSGQIINNAGTWMTSMVGALFKSCAVNSYPLKDNDDPDSLILKKNR
ncbi:hypothetical protein [Legionella jordanis]|uniref:Uncharacterized protein n=1 Tax=Legionella jordanis TaxID=456 RepID=A0A0W0VC08_9GAMM|nr:hypothetical protein [Legionella jordanis]KTD17666.1 hypothetical protein Ljor_1972 [Legionella jordanis]RMX01538.1 hypothetical protein EAW55_10585 [Legionella jordanis]RMX21533.1 hypothetical protein EAS68_01865 [Legionella jordanis]VEH11405.1 Uncharacterised protein [Legionella jordanis]